MRMYEAEWEALKQALVIRIKGDPSYHQRIFRGIAKEKNEDSAYKYWCQERFGTTRMIMLKREVDKADPEILIIRLTEI